MLVTLSFKLMMGHTHIHLQPHQLQEHHITVCMHASLSCKTWHGSSSSSTKATQLTQWKLWKQQRQAAVDSAKTRLRLQLRAAVDSVKSSLSLSCSRRMCCACGWFASMVAGENLPAFMIQLMWMLFHVLFMDVSNSCHGSAAGCIQRWF